MEQVKAPGGAGGFFGALFDFSFARLITGDLIKVLYALFIVCAILFALFLIITGFAASFGYGIVMLIIVAPLSFLISVVYARVVLEVMITIFRISEHTAKIAGEKEPGTSV